MVVLFTKVRKTGLGDGSGRVLVGGWVVNWWGDGVGW